MGYPENASGRDIQPKNKYLEIAEDGVRGAIQLARDVEEEGPTDLGPMIEEVAAAFDSGDIATLRKYSDPKSGFSYYTNLQLYLHELDKAQQ